MTMTSRSIELEIRNPSESQARDSNTGSNSAITEGDVLDEHEGIEFSSLPPVDRGKDAYMYLAAAFWMELLVWGFPFAYGIFQSHYTTHLPFSLHPSNISVIGTSSLGIMYMSSPLVFPILQRWPQTKRPAVALGLLTMCLALGLSSLCSTVGGLIATQGVLYAVGGSFAYGSVMLGIDEWFVARKGSAYGVMWAGTGLGGVVIPLLLQSLLSKYGFRTTLRIWSVVFFTFSIPLTYFLRSRVPASSHASRHRAVNFSFLTSRTFILLQTGNMLEGLGYFIPSIYLPSYARSLGASDSLSTLPVILFNITSVFGCVLMGLGIDRLHVYTCIAISTLGSTLSIFLLWGFSHHLSILLLFSCVYGLFAGCWSSTYPGVVRAVKNEQSVRGEQRREHGNADGMMVLALLGVGRGVGNLISGPVSEALVRKGGLGGYGEGYGGLVVFTGVSALCGGVGVLGWRSGKV